MFALLVRATFERHHKKNRQAAAQSAKQREASNNGTLSERGGARRCFERAPALLCVGAERRVARCARRVAMPPKLKNRPFFFFFYVARIFLQRAFSLLSRMRAQADPTEVAQGFVQTYYTMFGSDRQQLGVLYVRERAASASNCVERVPAHRAVLLRTAARRCTRAVALNRGQTRC